MRVEIAKGMFVFVPVPFIFRGRTFYKYREVKVTGFNDAGHVNVNPLHLNINGLVGFIEVK